MRTDKFISQQTGFSRREIKELIKKRLVTVNGRAVLYPEEQINPETDSIFIGKRKIIYKRFIYIMLNKPAGTVCAVRDKLSPTVLELLPEDLRRKGLFPAGRLDKDTEGFVFITDDGGLAHKITAPGSHVEKEYEVTLVSPAEDFYKEYFSRGITIDGNEKCRPADLIFTENKHMVRLILQEGKYHQVKRMMKAVGNSVASLRRIRIGGIVLDPSLAPGESREILHKEIENLYAEF